MATRDATVQYRYLKTDDLGERFVLKDVVVDILKRTLKGDKQPLSDLAKLRTIDLDQDGSVVMLNKMSAAKSWDEPIFFGQLICIKSGTQIPGIDGALDDDEVEYTLVNLNVGQNRSIVDGILYFVIVGNHVGIIEGQKARGRTLERYFTRLLQKAGEIEDGDVIILKAKLSGTLPKVNEMKILPKSLKPTDKTQETSSYAADGQGEGATVVDILKLLGWKENDINNLQEGIPEDGWLEGSFKVLFKSQRKRQEVDRGLVEEAIRNLGDHAVSLAGGGQEKNGIIKLSQRVQINLVGDLLDHEHAFKEILKMLETWSKQGNIDCDFTP